MIILYDLDQKIHIFKNFLYFKFMKISTKIA